MLNTKQLSSAIRYALFAGAASMLAAPAFAQEQENEEGAQVLDRVEVTGSRIARADIEGALPVTVIDRAQIEASGETSVADLLRGSTFNSFGSFRPQSGSSAQGVAQISLRGLGAQRTLILIDGRRLPASPFTGQGADLNTIPLGAIERIEILTDGASAVYGSDALGGVVNIITRKDYSGAELAYSMSDPTLQGGETEAMSAVVGIAGERGNLVAGYSQNSRGIIFTRERPWGAVLGLSTFANNYRLQSPVTGGPTGAFIRFPGFACNTDGFWVTAGNTCSFDFNSVAAEEAKVSTNGTFARGAYDINDDWRLDFALTSSRSNSFGRYAATPGEVFVPEGSPNDPVPGDGRGVFVRHRFLAAGNRDTTQDVRTDDIFLGLTGNIGEIGLDFGVRRNEAQAIELGRGYIVRPLAEQFIADGRYNLRNPLGNSPDVVNAIQATINREAFYIIDEAFGNAQFDLFEMAGGTASALVGYEWRREKYQDRYDSLQEANVILGSAGNSAGGGRQSNSIYFESLFPIIDGLELSAAARHDRFSDYGNDFSPKLSVRWQPLDTLTLRASVGEGFRAPTLDLITQQTSFSAEAVSDLQTCRAFGGTPAHCANPATQVQIDAFSIANPRLGSETSRQWSLGAVWDATDWLNIKADYYNIEITDAINSISPQDLINRNLGVDPRPIPPGLSVTRDPATGAITRLVFGFVNEGLITTDGIDLEINTDFDFGDWGGLRNRLFYSWVNSYEIDDGRTVTEFVDFRGQPQSRANLETTYSFSDFEFGWNVEYIARQDAGTVATPSWITHDLQATWKAPWNGRLTVGVLNLENELPVLQTFSGRVFNFNLYNAYGRQPFVRYIQSF